MQVPCIYIKVQNTHKFFKDRTLHMFMDYALNLEREKENLNKINIPDDARASILRFIRDMSIEGLSSGRLYAYALRLKTVAMDLQERFLDPSQDDVKDFMDRFQKRLVKWGGGKEHLPTDNAIQAYQVTFKRFYKWLLGDNETYPDCVKWIKIKTPHRSKQKKPESVISESELQKLLNACLNPRDKALISLLYDSGCRIGELLSMNIIDLAFDQYGAKITVSGKTGVRVVRIVGDSTIYLREWLKNHPDRDNAKAPLFTRLDGQIKERMDYEQVHALFRKVSKRADIKRRIYPHLFRHTRATLLSMNLKEPLLEKTMGWVYGSRMSQVYVHLSDSDVDNAVLRSHGIRVDEKSDELPRPKECPRCGEKNPNGAKYCRKCWLPLTIESTLDLKAKEDHIQQELESRGIINSQIKALIENMPESERTGILASIIELALKERDKKEPEK